MEKTHFKALSSPMVVNECSFQNIENANNFESTKREYIKKNCFHCKLKTKNI